ncbi:MAG TPA: CHAT domain-containing protein [Cytophagaceae bacterium]|jgi:CHAT domain-containing protein|nr:CHAT domain-containing protein [Cytophagaceae bacterium]
MSYSILKNIFFSFLVLVLWTWKADAQSQQDFMGKLSQVYANVGDQKKAMEIAKAMYKMLDQNKTLQTYSNYLMLTQIFEKQTPDKELAKSCKEKADLLLSSITNGSTGNSTNSTAISAQWNSIYFPALFSTTDPDNATKALNFLSENTVLQTFNNYSYIGYAFERNGDFQKAKENYERALTFRKNDKTEFHSYSYYTNFLSHSGEYLKAEEYIKKMEDLSVQAIDIYKISYKSEALTSKVAYYLSIGDYFAYLKAANEQYDHFSKMLAPAYSGCDPYSMGRYTLIAHAKEMLKEYKEAEGYWGKRDSAHYRWIDCNNQKFPEHKQYPLSELPVFLMKTGKKNLLAHPTTFYVNETETHYKSYSQYADLSINFMKADQLGFLGAEQYHEGFKKILDQITTTKDFRSSTLPFSEYAYFNMRDRRLEQAKDIYHRLFSLNSNWINDIIFSFGEKAFVTYYNAKLKEGYENYHSFVKIAKEKKTAMLPELSSQAYTNLLFTKSLSLKGTQKRKQAFLNSNDPSIAKLYTEWIEKKQELIRLYRRSEDASPELKNSVDKEEVKSLQENVNHLENELALKAKGFQKYLKIEPPDWKTTRAQLKEGEAAIEMVRFQWRDQLYYSDTSFYAAYIITQKSTYPEVVYLPDVADILDNKYYKLYQNIIKFKLEDTILYKHYWQPIREQLKGIKKVYFSPDGIYHLINLSTLKNPETHHYLLEELDVQYVTSSIDVQNNSVNHELKTAVLIGRPSYKMDVNPTTYVAMADETTRSFVRNFRGNNISDLPGTEEEVLAIRKEMDKDNIQVTLYTHDQATEEKVYNLHSPDILHIATHGYWSEIGYASTDGYRVFNAMVNSGLLLSGVVNYYSATDYPDTYDGILTAYEAQNLDLENTSLVVLSACETSLGHLDAGEGIYGLQRAFRSAGAKSIITSLWKVDDEATKTFMILFYQNFLKTKNKFQAFNSAQKTLKEKYQHPYFWGAFILSGI